MRVDELSIGDYVLAGGEVATLVIVEAVARLLPGVLGNPDSLVEESHSAGLLEYPVYTKPARWRDLEVPPVLLSGHHGQIARWRRDEALRRTLHRRPDLVSRLAAAGQLDARDLEMLADEGWQPG
jgi:tRNA (guanine37-N1)-methyltransferase